jgi:ABC-type transporter Mla MlaB component
MTVRITIVSDRAPRRVSLEGRLTRSEVGELEQAIGDDPRGVCLDLENLRSADEDGLAALSNLRHGGAVLRNVPPHLAWRVEPDA